MVRPALQDRREDSYRSTNADDLQESLGLVVAELLDVVPDINGDDVVVDGAQLAGKGFFSQAHLDLNDVRSVAAP